jgi:hypothetical protein
MLVSWVWRQRRLAASQTTPTPATSITKRSKEPTPFVGRIHKPHCDACEHAIELHPQAPSSLPPLVTYTRGRQRTIDTQPQFCPDHECTYYGWVGQTNIRANGHPGDAIAALRRLLSDEGRLQRMRMIGRAEALDREDLAPHHRREGGDAGADHGAIDGDGAGPALCEPAAELGGIELELVAPHVEQGGVGGDIHHVGTPVDLERDGHGTLQVMLRKPNGVGGADRRAAWNAPPPRMPAVCHKPMTLF